MAVRLHVNVDHVATLRKARGTTYPDPTRAARECEAAGADGITVHLREDRRHIEDADVERLRRQVGTLLNLEMAATDEMVGIASRLRPHLITLVPEKREERTTEGGLDVAGHADVIANHIRVLTAAGVPVSLFLDPDPAQVGLAREVGACAVELHTGDYANADAALAEAELKRLDRAAEACPPGVRLAAGHGLNLANVAALVSRLAAVEELNIGHALVADAVFLGMREAVRAYRAAIAEGEARRPGSGGGR